MAPDRFADEFGQLYRQLYSLAVRRIADGREQLSAETAALLMHLAQSGPLSLSDMARHFDRALSTLSVKVAALEADGLLARQRDDGDARRALIWLSSRGREVLDQAMQVLDARRLSAAAERLSDERREQLLAGLHELIAVLALSHSPHPTAGGPDDDPSL
ncbi:MAG TPA: MarR family transcriptional regulator [Ramlibacter sp.]|nr:MarR family transcriptional regulator [Ramlibacter sp.]